MKSKGNAAVNQYDKNKHDDKNSRNESQITKTKSNMNQEKERKLQEWEKRLTDEVDADFFDDPSSFQTLHRVIDVLGAQLLDGDDGKRSSSSATMAKIFGTTNNSSTNTTNNNKTFMAVSANFDNLHKNNPAYLSLRKQQGVVEDAIEYLCIHHPSDLNTSVAAVGRVSKQFDEAVGRVQSLRRQVRDIRENLASCATSNNEDYWINGTSNDNINPSSGIPKEDMDIDQQQLQQQQQQQQQQRGKSLRELWLKKLECESVLSLLRRLEIVRDAPTSFDSLIIPFNGGPCRIVAAVVLLSEALSIIFADDMSQIQALQNITEQLMMRKQKAEEMLWDTLLDVLYLRTGNRIGKSTMETSGVGTTVPKTTGRIMLDTDDASSKKDKNGTSHSSTLRSSLHPASAMRRRRHKYVGGRIGGSVNGSIDGSLEGSAVYDSDSDYEDDDASSMFSDEYSSQHSGGGDKSSSRMEKKRSIGNSSDKTKPSITSLDNDLIYGYQGTYGRLLPRSFLDSELDLEADELRCLETSSINFGRGILEGSVPTSSNSASMPKYNDPVMALRILVESIAKLGRLDDVERCISENVVKEVKHVARLAQARTLARMEKRRNTRTLLQRRAKISVTGGQSAGAVEIIVGGDGYAAEEKLADFRVHLKSLLTSFGSVMLRLSYLAQILRHRITTDPKIITPSYSTPSSALHSVLVAAHTTMQREIKEYVKACLNEDEELASSFANSKMVTPSMMDSTVSNRKISSGLVDIDIPEQERGIFSLGIISDASLASSVREKYAQSLSSASRSNAMQMSAEEYVQNILCPRTGTVPQVSHALVFRRCIATWTLECEDLKKELAHATAEDTSTPSYNATTEETALNYLDDVIKKTLLPVMQDAAVNGTLSALEKIDAFEPAMGSTLYGRTTDGSPEVDMCLACQALYNSTGPVFAALNRLPRGGEMYSPLVAVLEQAVLLFLSRVAQRVTQLCSGKTAFELLEGENGSAGRVSKRKTPFSIDMETRKSFLQLLNAYYDEDDVMSTSVDTPTNLGGSTSIIKPLSPSLSDTKSKNGENNMNENGDVTMSHRQSPLGPALDMGTDLQHEQETFEFEVSHLRGILDFMDEHYGDSFDLCSEEELMKSASLAHSLLKVSSLLERRLKSKKALWGKAANPPRALREPIKTIKMHAIRMAKFCRVDMLLQTVRRLALVAKDSSLTAKDTVRLPGCINELGEYYALMSDLLRESGGNVVAAYTFSSLEQYIPLFLMQNVRIIATGDGLDSSFKVSFNGIEALDRSCSVLYRDLKGSTSFDNSFWDEIVAADAFERAASYVAMMELDMEELVSYYRSNRSEFTDNDYKIMFGMNGPRRKPDIKRYALLKE